MDIYSDTVRAASCDISRLTVTENKCECGGKLSVTIPKQSFFYLASAVEDKDELQIGLSDGESGICKTGHVVFNENNI